MKIVFMGTPDFAVEPLKKIIEQGHEVVLAVTMPDKPKGRGYEETPPPVKVLAQHYGIPLAQPVKIKDEAFIKRLKDAEAEVFVVVAYGKILTKEILDIPKLACINIHASLLPDYRGAAPIQRAVLDGRKESGITTMLMDTGLDTGDILQQYPVALDEDETAGSLFDKLAKLGATAIADTLEHLPDYIRNRRPQGESKTPYAAMLKKEDGLLDFTRSVAETERFVRGMNPWPSAFAYLEGKSFKIWEGKAAPQSLYEELVKPEDTGKYGRIFIRDEEMYVLCKDGLLQLLIVQLEGKKRMEVKAFLRGYKIEEERLLRR